MAMTRDDLSAVPGVGECDLDAETVAALPDGSAPAPWAAECASIIWYARGNRAAAAASGVEGRPLIVIGGLVSYAQTPVGSYREVFGMIALAHGRAVRGTIPFMAVDSPASLVGGRSNWSLPKSLASFEGSPEQGSMSASGATWQVQATARPFGPHYPVPMRGRLVQRWPDGRPREAVLSGHGRARSALVTVEVRSAGPLAEWLRPGQHPGAVLSATRFALSAMH
ncbi:MAG: hypothetical protein QOE97_3612 [Pseudonocardiales bacterium]|jgi:hypothetical protein|nr:hypothetical protein [Pseudonocardiales bacterium]